MGDQQTQFPSDADPGPSEHDSARSPAEDQSLSEFIAATLANRDLACASCGYNLRGVLGSTCPECGTAIKITLGRADRSTLPWFIALIVYAAATGVAGLWTSIVAMILIFGGPNSEGIGVGAAGMITFALAATVLTFIVRRRHDIWDLPAVRQWLLVFSVLGIPMFFLIAVVISLALTV